ncbi:MAG: hypothetical protein AAFV77_11385, partial [Planctomycetota bacterium]
MSEEATNNETVETPEPQTETLAEAPSAPDWLDQVPEQYRRTTAEETLLEVEKARKNLEGKMRQPKDDRLAIGGAGVPESIEDVIVRTGLDFETFLEAAEAEGGLSDEVYETIRDKAGVGKGIVNDMLAARRHEGLEAQRRSEANYEAAIKVVGSEEATRNLLTWAGAHLSEGEQVMY